MSPTDTEDLPLMFQKISGRTDGWTDSGNESSIDYDFMSRHPTLSIIFLCFTSIAAFAGTIGNMMVIGAVSSYRPLLQNKGSMFVINLAIADLCITMIVCPMNMVGVTKGPRFFLDKVLLCNILGSICTVSCIVSMLSIAAVAVNRAIQICKFFFYEQIFTKKKTLCYCVGIWVIAIAGDLPNWFGPGGHTFALKEMGCTFDRLANYTFTVILATTTTLFPMVTVLVSYLKIMFYVHTAREKYRSMFGGLSKQRKHDEIQFALTLFVAFIVFVLCWSIYYIALIFDRYDEWPKQVYVFGTFFGHSNSFLNPIIYAALNERFRIGYKRFLRRLCCKKLSKIPLQRGSISTTHTSRISRSTTSTNVSNSSINKRFDDIGSSLPS